MALLVLRLVVTPLAVGSGTVGGVFTPTLFLGRDARARLRRRRPGAAPALGADPAAFALAGMGFLLAGTTHAPLTAVVMVFEMTLDYGIVVPLLLGSAVASLVATRLSANSVYTEALQRKAGEAERDGGRARRAARGRPGARRPGDGGARAWRCRSVLDASWPRAATTSTWSTKRGGFVGAVNLHDVNEALRAAGGAGRAAWRAT